MQHAKRMILVDEQLLESLKGQYLRDKLETKQWEKPADIRSKTNSHMIMKDIVNDTTLGDDVKAKLYNQEFSKFKRVKQPKTIKEESVTPTDVNNPIVDDLVDLNTFIDNPKQKKQKKRKATTAYTPIRTRSFKRKKAKLANFDWVEY